MPPDPMTLLERLRNPAYHGSGLTRGKPADLDVKQTVADMAEAAAEIERLRDECVSLRLTIEGQREQAEVAKTVFDRLRKSSTPLAR